MTDKEISKLIDMDKKIARIAMKCNERQLKKFTHFVGIIRLLDTVEYWRNDSDLVCNLRKRFKFIRHDNGYTLMGMARRLSRSYNSYRGLERGDKENATIKTRDLKALIHEFGVSIEWLLLGENSVYDKFTRGIMMLAYDYNLVYENCLALHMYIALQQELKLKVDSTISTLYNFSSTDNPECLKVTEKDFLSGLKEFEKLYYTDKH